MDKYDEALARLGLSLPDPPTPAANYVPYVVSGNQVFVAGQIPLVAGEVRYIGKVGREFSVAEGQDAARTCALNILAHVKKACGGNLDRVVRCVRLGGFVNCLPEFTEQPQVVNGASDLMVAVFGDRGRHARAAVGSNALPRGVAVEVEAVFEIVPPA